MEHMGELTPLIYTPTVGEACEKFSEVSSNFQPSFDSSLALPNEIGLS